ncbi:MAG: dynamin family protein [Treponema sp.]|nr:dynamin family protein [Treponema sp.]MEE3435844.1 dynamin family protein [Treponema sp.]
MDNLAQQKINALQMSIALAEESVESLSGVRPDIYSIRKSEWTEKIKEMRKSIIDEALLMFIGPFSSGKSSFVNALLGEDVLPTANTPCTAVVTEISFTDGGGDRGKIYYRNNPKEGLEIDFDELKNIINGPTGAQGEVAQYHHVELILDVTESENRNQFRAFIGLIRIVDCPGFGSPYFANEDIIVQYIERASFTFWMSPCDKFGGRTAEEYLKLIKKNTTSLIPLITKSDKITDEDEREKIKYEFSECLSSFFKIQDLRFVSAFQFKEAQEYYKKLQKGDNSIEERYYTLYRSCGIEYVLSAMQTCATKEKIDEKKVDSLLFDTCGILNELSLAANKEKGYWESKLKENRWNKEEGKFSELEIIKKDTDVWIKGEAKRVSDGFKNELVQKLISNFGTTESSVDVQLIKNCWKEKVDKEAAGWTKRLKEQYTEYIRQYVPIVENDVDLAVGKYEIELFNKVGNIIGATLEALKIAGAQSIITASVGALLLTSTAAIGSVPMVGGALLGIAAVAGPAMLGVAILPLIPAIAQGVKRRNESDKIKRENELRHQLDTLNVAPAIEEILGETHNKIYNDIIGYLNADIVEPKTNYDICSDIAGKVKEELSNIEGRIGYLPKVRI